jgi:hypothetical protein
MRFLPFGEADPGLPDPADAACAAHAKDYVILPVQLQGQLRAAVAR